VPVTDSYRFPEPHPCGMVTPFGWAYLTAGTLLFFFWAYGIIRFVMDLRNIYIPKTRQYIRGRRRLKQRREEEDERDEQEQQLY
jgi:hypothetical protein